MWEDPIVNELRRIREAFAAKHNFDLREMYKALKEQEAKNDRPPLSFPPRRIKPQKFEKRSTQSTPTGNE